MRKRLRLVLLGLGLIVWTGVLLLGFELEAAFKGSAARFRPWQLRWTRGLLSMAGVRLSVVGQLPDPGEASFLVVSNHRSTLDIPVLLHLVQAVILSRGDVADWPILGRAAKAAGTLFVDRDDTGSRTGALRGIRRALREGQNALVFPEGTTFEGDEVRPFHRGAFSAAKSQNALILPIGLAYPPGHAYVEERFMDHLKNIAFRGGFRLGVSLGEPLPLHKDSAQSADLARQAVQAEVNRARAHLEGTAS